MEQKHKERPILMSAPMVLATLDGRKTQTRSLVKPQPSEMWRPKVGFYSPIMVDRHGEEYPGAEVFGASDADEGRICPFGVPGDRLWVREAFSRCACDTCRSIWPKQALHDAATLQPHGVTYRATHGGPSGLAWRPSIHMPRWASRITLEITDVRVERLQDISEEDAKAEGSYLGRCPCMPRGQDKTPLDRMFSLEWCHIHGTEFRRLWNSINGEVSWESNPWVWARTYRRVTA